MEEAEDIDTECAGGANTGHRRITPGNVLSRLPFMRSSSSSNLDKSPGAAVDGSNEAERVTVPSGSSSLSVVQQNSKVRKRKGSLRKTALLGKGMLGFDRKGSDAKSPKSPLSSQGFFTENEKADSVSRKVAADAEARRDPSREDADPPSPSNSSSPISKILLSSVRSTVPSAEPAPSHTSVLSGVAKPVTDRSTPDDEDPILPLPKPLPSDISRKFLSSSNGDSYFHSQPVFRSRKGGGVGGGGGTNNRVKSPLATQPQSQTASPAPSEEEAEWDYSETAFWGYVILIITWLVVVVGMGSCFDVWSWAWDVGETPYAPPELNDDPTLPIVGYYPALMVLTSVMAWVWVVAAWVGMKYFRHAEGRADDG